MNLTVGKVYAVFSEAGATATLRNGAVLEFPAGQPVTLVAQQATLELDGDAVVREIPNGNAVLLGEMLERQNSLPEGYTRVEYLESQNHTGLATDFYPTNLTEIDADIERLTDDFYGRLFGTTGGGGAWLALHENAIEFTWDWGRARYLVGDGVDLNTRHKLRCGCGRFSVNGELKWQIENEKEWTSNRPIYIFTSSESSVRASGCFKCFRFRVLENEKVIFDFVPTLDNVGAPCFFELNSKTPYYNIGTLDFLYPGQELEPTTFSLRRPVTYAQLTEHGVRRLYRVPRGYNGTKEEYAMEHGFKPLVETPQPEEGYWAPEWRETDEEIVLEWVETEPPTDDYLTQPTE